MADNRNKPGIEFLINPPHHHRQRFAKLMTARGAVYIIVLKGPSSRHLPPLPGPEFSNGILLAGWLSGRWAKLKFITRHMFGFHIHRVVLLSATAKSTGTSSLARIRRLTCLLLAMVPPPPSINISGNTQTRWSQSFNLCIVVMIIIQQPNPPTPIYLWQWLLLLLAWRRCRFRWMGGWLVGWLE